MKTAIRVAAIIPARMASSRLPGKPLLEVSGLPMVEHVRRRALLCRRFSEVVVATCDREIAAVVEGYGGVPIMTSPHHPAATDRVAEAVRRLDCTHVVNVQGDEILVLPSDLEKFADALVSQPDIPAWNALAPIEQAEELSDPAVVKCAVSVSGRVLFCSRDFSSFPGRPDGSSWPLRRILGILGYRQDFLERYGTMVRTPLERAQAIDQLRIIEHDVILQGVEFSKGYPGINEPREVQRVERYLREDPAQHAVLRSIVEQWPAPLST